MRKEREKKKTDDKEEKEKRSKSKSKKKCTFSRMAVRSSSDMDCPRALLLRGVRFTLMMDSNSKYSSSKPSARVALLPSASSRVMKAFHRLQYE